MVGGGGDAPPPLNGGEFLLHLLKNPPHHQPPHHHQQQPSQTLPHDPAVAAVGPTILPFPSNSHDLPYRTPPPFAPHNYFNTQGFPLLNPNPNLNNSNLNPNPSPNWPSSSSSSPPGFNFIHNPPINVQNRSNFFDDLRKLGLSNRNQQEHNKLVFGSLPSEVLPNGNSDFNLAHEGKFEGLLVKEREMGIGNRRLKVLEKRELKPQVNSLAFGNYRSMESSPQVVRPPLGFGSKPRNVEKRNFEQNVEKGKGNSSNNGNEREILHFGDSLGERGLAGQLDEPGPSSGRNLHSIPATDIEVSLTELHIMDDEDVKESRNNLFDKRELDELDQRFRNTIDTLVPIAEWDEKTVDTLVLEDISDEKNDRKQHPKSRDKDYRSDKRGQWILNQRMRNYKSQTECRSNINRLNAPFLAIYESLIPAEEEKAKQKQLLKLLEKHVTKEWPEARLYLYGSCANSFGFRKSDIDVCLAIEDADINKADILLKLADILQSDNLQNVQALTRARVPIVKLMDPATGISCDICVNNVLAVINTKLLLDYSKIDVRLRQLAFIVKHWAKSRGVNETYQGTLSSYAYVLMCIHFLQQRRPSILPCLQAMERTYAVTIDDVECAYFDQVEKLRGFGSRNGESIAQLVWAFFNYWAYCHDYTNDVISIRTGSLLSKRAKDWTRRVGNDRHLICIEDPFEVSHDLGRVVDKYSIRVLREEFERAAKIMQDYPDPCVSLFQPYVPT